jgi:hypothetical protein
MRIVNLHDEFTKDLESFVKTPIQIPFLEEWNPKKVAAPERHLSLGKDRGSVDLLIYTLENENETLENISSLLRIFLDRKVLRGAKIDPVKEQIWLFGQKWFSVYYELLTEAEIIRSEFFRNHHDDFLNILRQMLQVNPKKRISFLEALIAWHPASYLIEESESEQEQEQEQEQENEKESEVVQESIQVQETIKVQEPIQVQESIKVQEPIQVQEPIKVQEPSISLSTISLSPSVSLPPPVTSSSKSSSNRLVLNGFSRNGEHNRTRKSLRS